MTTRKSLSAHDPIIDSLRKRGYRVTPQRVMILAAMQESDGHVSADEVFQRVKKKHPYVNRSTIYRTLDMLAGEGVITVTDFGKASAQYEVNRDEPHHHMVCSLCGEVGEFDHALLAPLQAALRKKYRFEASIHHFAVFGLCQACQPRPAKARHS
ncbi:MAG: transcriptional repressor [Chloroflexi bacterium]|nr:transcriptional repressor [Chloroflexota bacterium]